MDEISKAWVKTPVALLRDPTVSAIEVNVYSVLLDKADQALNVKMSHGEIAKETGVHRHTVMRALESLEKSNWIQIHKTGKQTNELIYHLREIIPSKNKKKAKSESDLEGQENFSFNLQEYKDLANTFDK